MSKINDYLLIGDYKDSEDFYMLKNKGVTHILCAAGELKPNFPNKFKYKYIRGSDEPKFDLGKHFDEAADFIYQAVRSGGKVMVHCYAGVSRSTSCLIAYLIKYKGYTFREGLELCLRGRPIVEPNPGFQRQLQAFEAYYNYNKRLEEKSNYRSRRSTRKRYFNHSKSLNRSSSRFSFVEKDKKDKELRCRDKEGSSHSRPRISYKRSKSRVSFADDGKKRSISRGLSRDRSEYLRERRSAGRSRSNTPKSILKNRRNKSNAPKLQNKTRDKESFPASPQALHRQRSTSRFVSRTEYKNPRAVERERRSMSRRGRPKLIENLNNDYDERVEAQKRRAILLGSSYHNGLINARQHIYNFENDLRHAYQTSTKIIKYF